MSLLLVIWKISDMVIEPYRLFHAQHYHALGVFVHSIEFRTSFPYHPNNFCSIHEERLMLFFEKGKLEVGEEVAEEFAFPVHAERGEGVACTRGAKRE